METNIYKIFLLSDEKEISSKVRMQLRKFSKYELTVLPTVYNEFDLFNFSPDVILIEEDNKIREINCYKWETNVPETAKRSA